VARRAELAVLTGARDLAEHVLVDVTLGVAVLHRHRVEQITTCEQRRSGDGEARVLHVVAVGGLVAAQRAKEGKYVPADHGVHVAGAKCLKRDLRRSS